jgi:hypothetical protein
MNALDDGTFLLYLNKHRRARQGDQGGRMGWMKGDPLVAGVILRSESARAPPDALVVSDCSLT